MLPHQIQDQTTRSHTRTHKLMFNVMICGNLLLNILSLRTLWHIKIKIPTPSCTVQYINTLLKERAHRSCSPPDLCIDRGRGRNSQKCRKNSCSIRPAQWPEDFPAMLASCARISDILLHGHYLILHTLVCQSNSRLASFPESDPSAKIFRQNLLEDSHLTEWAWEQRLWGKSECMNAKHGNGKWTSMSQAGSDRKNDSLRHRWDGSQWAVLPRQRAVEPSKDLSRRCCSLCRCCSLLRVLPLCYHLMKWNNGSLAGSIMQPDAGLLPDRKQIVTWG